MYNPYGNEKREVKILETQKRDMTKFRFQGGDQKISLCARADIHGAGSLPMRLGF